MIKGVLKEAGEKRNTFVWTDINNSEGNYSVVLAIVSIISYSKRARR